MDVWGKEGKEFQVVFKQFEKMPCLCFNFYFCLLRSCVCVLSISVVPVSCISLYLSFFQGLLRSLSCIWFTRRATPCSLPLARHSPVIQMPSQQCAVFLWLGFSVLLGFIPELHKMHVIMLSIEVGYLHCTPNLSYLNLNWKDIYSSSVDSPNMTSKNCWLVPVVICIASQVLLIGEISFDLRSWLLTSSWSTSLTRPGQPLP